MKKYGPFPLYLSVRSIPEDCPFKDAYHFTYNNNTGGFCTNPTSYAKSCASASKFRFHFKHCPDAAYTHDAGINQTLSLIHMSFKSNLILFFDQKIYTSIVSPQCCCRHNKKESKNYQLFCKYVVSDILLLNVPDWDLECYANWQQGDLTFMYGKFTMEGSAPSQDVYRCFVSTVNKLH